jgi:hypothetical protein
MNVQYAPKKRIRPLVQTRIGEFVPWEVKMATGGDEQYAKRLVERSEDFIVTALSPGIHPPAKSGATEEPTKAATKAPVKAPAQTVQKK